MTKAAAIVYRNLTVYLEPTSQYINAREGSIAAAEDLQNAGILTADDVEEVIAAWCAVGVGCGITPGPDDPDPPTGNCNRLTDSLALIALYNSTNGPNWLNTWNLNQSMDNWFGVSLNEDGCVKCLDLDGNESCGSSGSTNNLIGNIPLELGNLSNVQSIFLSYNQLSGTIPLELGNLSSLTTLMLIETSLSGSIPPELGNLINLRSLALYKNQLNGIIPPELGDLQNLESLNLRSNQLSGSIPAALANLDNLKYLTLSNNQLTGSIPSSLGNLNNLEHLSTNSVSYTHLTLPTTPYV